MWSICLYVYSLCPSLAFVCWFCTSCSACHALSCHIYLRPAPLGLDTLKCLVCQWKAQCTYIRLCSHYGSTVYIANIHLIPNSTVWFRSSLPVAFVQQVLANSSSLKKTSNNFLANVPASGGGQQFTLWNSATAASDSRESTRCCFDLGFPQTISVEIFACVLMIMCMPLWW